MTTERLPVEQYYFGRMYAPPPGDFPFIMTIIVVPFFIIPFSRGRSVLYHEAEGRSAFGWTISPWSICISNDLY